MVHRRRFTKGSRPGLTCKAVVGGADTRLEDESWIPPSRKPGSSQKKRMAGCVLRSACRMVMNNHYYTYDNIITKQSNGGSIRNKLAEKHGRLLMKRHNKNCLKLLKKLKLELELFERYVDNET